MSASLFLALFLAADLSLNGRTLFVKTALGHQCQPVRWNRGALPSYCTLFKAACVDHGSRIVLHEQRFQIDNVRRENTPFLQNILWNLPTPGSAFPDSLVGWQPDFTIHVRPVSKAEPTPQLRHPAWSNCTLPVVLMVDYPYNYKSFVVKALTEVDHMFRVHALTPDNDATLVLATPAGLALEPYHTVLLSQYSRRPLITLAELGRRSAEAGHVEWSGEGVRVHCFDQLIACKLDHQEAGPPQDAALAVMSHLTTSLPHNPLGFEAAALEPGVLRVVVEQRTAGWRTIRNVDQILRACEQEDKKGFLAGPFTRIVCKALPAPLDSDVTTAGASPSSPGAAALRQELGAVRSAHLYITMAGSRAAHAFFMQLDPGVGGSGLVEVRPCRWGSEYAARVDVGQEAMAEQLARGDDMIRFFAYNVEDPAQCSPPDYAPALDAARSALPPPGATAHQHQPRSPPRYQPEELLVRDQHVTLRPGPLLVMIRHSAAVLSNKDAYRSLRTAGRLHGYAVAEGLLLGPLGLRDAAAAAAAESGDAMIRVP